MFRIASKKRFISNGYYRTQQKNFRYCPVRKSKAPFLRQIGYSENSALSEKEQSEQYRSGKTFQTEPEFGNEVEENVSGIKNFRVQNNEENLELSIVRAPSPDNA